MEDAALRLLIRQKLSDRRLPQNSIPRIWGGPGNGEKCQACDEEITPPQFIIEGLSRDDGGVQFHVQCFYLWDALRSPKGHAASGPA